ERRLEQDLLDEAVQRGADYGRRQEGDEDADDESPGSRVARQLLGDPEQTPRIDGDDGEDGAELNQHLEGLAGGFEAEEVPGEQDVTGRADRNEFRQALERAEQQRVQNPFELHVAPRSGDPLGLSPSRGGSIRIGPSRTGGGRFLAATVC